MQDDEDLVHEILKAQTEGRQILRLTARPGGLSIGRAYDLSSRIEEIRRHRGERLVGRKIGFTNRTIWSEFNVSAPVFGSMYDTTVRPLGALFATADLLEPRIEPEIAFRFVAPPHPGMRPDELIGCVSEVCAGFEIVQSIFANWAFEGADTVAAFGLHGAFLHGPMQSVSPVNRANWITALSTLETTLSRDGIVADVGHARNVMDGGPLAALGHLVDLMASTPHAKPLAKGDLVTTGTLTRALPVSPGEKNATHDVDQKKIAGLLTELDAKAGTA